jgi:signal transduction histidine kinase/Na+/proline symporter
VRVTRTMRISSIADFISIRYGKNGQLGTLVAVACFVGVIPYIALQLKAIDNSVSIISEQISFDSSIFIVLLLTVFAILFGARNVDANQRKPGLISAIAFESLVKLLAFLSVGVFVVYGLFNGWFDLFSQAAEKLDMNQLSTLSGDGDFADWFFISLVSAIAFLLLPRQFQVGSVEAGKEEHILTAMRVAPIYLLLINVFVVPIAFAGLILSPDSNPDFQVLSLPLLSGNGLLAMFVFLGGFSAATSMILVSTTALSTMMSNYVFIPLILKSKKEEAAERTDYHNILLFWRRISIVIIMLLAFSYFKFLTSKESLVSIGIISFIAVAQLAPAFFGGLYWKRANNKAATAAIISGLSIWFLFLVLPNIALELSDIFHNALFEAPNNIVTAITEHMGLSRTSASIIMSLMVNVLLYVYFSLATNQSAKEVNQAELFVDIYKYSKSYDSSVAWRGTAYFPDIKSLLNQFIGKDRTDAVLDRYARRHGIDWDANPKVDARVISYAERVLTGIIGPSSARIMVSNVVEEEEIGLNDVLNILQESQEALRLNRELQLKSQQLAKATEKLTSANAKLQEFSDLKNEFLYTVTHELRTPITSIRAMAELLEDHADMPNEERAQFVGNIIYEAERMTKLISNVLDLEKFESGNQQLERAALDLKALIKEEIQALNPLIGNRNIEVKTEINSHLEPVFADEERIRQVITNLLSNAVKYCDQNEGLILITAYCQDDYVKVNVSNNGSGIKQEDISTIFDKFYQVKHQSVKKPTGHGLGLAICKNIIEMHKGKIGVELAYGMVRFSFSLPVYRK